MAIKKNIEPTFNINLNLNLINKIMINTGKLAIATEA